MSALNDTTPDAPPDEAKTDPTSAVGPHDATAPLPPSPARHSADTAPGLDSLLGGIDARAPVDPRRRAESAGEDAAAYATTAEPARTTQHGSSASSGAVIIAVTEPFPYMPATPPQAAALSPPAPALPTATGAAPRATPRRATTTVPGQRRQDRRRWLLVLALGVVVIASAGLVLFGGKPSVTSVSGAASGAAQVPDTAVVPVALPAATPASSIAAPAASTATLAKSARPLPPIPQRSGTAAPNTAVSAPTPPHPIADPSGLTPRPASSGDFPWRQ